MILGATGRLYDAVTPRRPGDNLKDARASYKKHAAGISQSLKLD